MPSDILALVGMLVAMAAVLGLAYLFTRYVAARGLVGGMPSAPGRRMKVLDQLPLGKDQKLALVQAGERYFLLGVTPAGMTNLAELTAEEAALWSQTAEGGDQPHPPSFRDALLGQLKTRTKK